MYYLAVISLFLVSVLSIRVSPVKNHAEPLFQNWVSQYNKVYPSAVEYHKRLSIFGENLKRIARLNRDSQKHGGATFNVTKFSDLTPAEFKSLILNPLIKGVKPEDRVVLDLPGNAVPDTFDWKSLNKITPVKDQGQCGSCWAFSATENIESVWMIAKSISASQIEPLAPQQIVDCDNSDSGCNGGDTPTAYEYVISAGGQEPEKDYPYKAQDETCRFKKADVYATISGYKYATKTKNEAEMKEAVATVAPLSICVDAEPWQSYSGGILTARQCGDDLDHCVQITGYDTSASTPYWSVRNSWGSDWGENGYIRLEYGTNTCGLADEATTATV
jgi:C1A family cysteine protease